MSCYMVPHAHIDALLDIHDQFMHVLPSNVKTQVGRALLAENGLSVCYRYKDESPKGLADDAASYEYRGTAHKFSADDALGVLTCYEYQACEHPGYSASEANKMISAIREKLITASHNKSQVWVWNSRLPLLDITIRLDKKEAN